MLNDIDRVSKEPNCGEIYTIDFFIVITRVSGENDVFDSDRTYFVVCNLIGMTLELVVRQLRS